MYQRRSAATVTGPERTLGPAPSEVPVTLETLPLHGLEEFAVRLGVLHLVEQEFNGRELIHGVQELAQNPHLRELALVGNELLLTRAGAVDVDRRENTLLGDAPVEMDLAVAGT